MVETLLRGIAGVDMVSTRRGSDDPKVLERRGLFAAAAALHEQRSPGAASRREARAELIMAARDYRRSADTLEANGDWEAASIQRHNAAEIHAELGSKFSEKAQRGMVKKDKTTALKELYDAAHVKSASGESGEASKLHRRVGDMMLEYGDHKGATKAFLQSITDAVQAAKDGEVQDIALAAQGFGKELLSAGYKKGAMRLMQTAYDLYMDAFKTSKNQTTANICGMRAFNIAKNNNLTVEMGDLEKLAESLGEAAFRHVAVDSVYQAMVTFKDAYDVASFVKRLDLIPKYQEWHARVTHEVVDHSANKLPKTERGAWLEAA